MKLANYVFLLGTILCANPYPADVGLCIVDLKFDGQTIKICEFGQGTVSQFNGYDALYGQGAMFTKVWGQLRNIHPILEAIFTHHMSELAGMYAISELSEAEKISVLSLDQLCSATKTIKRRMSLCHQQQIAFYDGIIITFNTRVLKNIIRAQEVKAYDRFIILDRATTYWVNNKCFSDQLFDEPWLRVVRPGCFVCEKAITIDLLQEVIRQMPSDYYVIKPLNASKGMGIVMVAREELAETVQSLFGQEAKVPNRKEKEYEYWLRDKNKTFLLEQFCPSKIVEVDGHPYDPTMRVAFILSNNEGKTQVTFLDAYWKLPERSLDQKGSMTQKHKSHINKKHHSSYRVEPDDFNKVTMLLEPVLLSVYEKMLARTYACAL
ncbi:MAG: hypothetical protein WCT20_01585 [Candidatus Babeliales bacterium]